MSERPNLPCYGTYQAQLGLERAEAVINAICELYGYLAAMFTRSAWRRASA
jgi:hypothetical protein